MNKLKYASLFCMLALCAGFTSAATLTDDDDDDVKGKSKVLVSGEKISPATTDWTSDSTNLPVDTLYMMRLRRDSLERASGIVEIPPYPIMLRTRAYGDSIVLRWAPSEYVPWRYLNGSGYIIVRGHIENETWISDTLGIVRAWNRYKFQDTFAAADSLAGAAVQTIFGEGTALNNTRSAPGSAGSILEVYEQQQNTFGMAMLIAEMRPDLATAMGLRYVDSQVKRGVKYQYTILPNIADSILHASRAAEYVVNEPFKPEPCTVELYDSLTTISSVTLEWEYAPYSAYNIERRKGDTGNWQQINTKPYISMSMDFSTETPLQRYVDEDVAPGTYYYRLRGLDAFGDWSAPGPEHRVDMPDLVPPAPPVIKHITIHRGDSAMTATIDYSIRGIEGDLLGYIPFYQYGAVTEDGQEVDPSMEPVDSVVISQGWVPLMKDNLVSPGDTTVTVDITGLSSGMVTIAAVDTAMNMTYAMPMPIRIVDMVPPEPPTNVRSIVSPDGIVTLIWTPSVSQDAYFYEVFLANDTTHTFTLAPNMQIWQDTVWHDTLSMQVNQAYKYYKVRAIDYTGNNSVFSPIHRCVRPNFNAPSECWADSIWSEGRKVYSRWVVSPEKDVDEFKVYRRLTKDRQWTYLGSRKREDFTGPYLVWEDEPEPEQVQRYYYAMTASNLTGVSTGMSQPVCIWFRGQRVFDIPINLEGTYKAESGQTVLGWTVKGDLPVIAPYHFVIYRQLEGEDFFRPYTSVNYDRTDYSDFRLKPGQTTKYKIQILYEDGRESTFSNVVTIKAPKKKEQKEKK